MRTINHNPKFKHKDDGNYFAYPLPEGIEIVDRNKIVGDVERYIYISDTKTHVIVRSGGIRVVKSVFINERRQSVNGLPAYYQIDSCDDYIDYFYSWYEAGLSHRVNAPAKLWFRNGVAVQTDFYLFGICINTDHYKWFRENGIKLSKMAEEDLLLFKMKWCDNV